MNIASDQVDRSTAERRLDHNLLDFELAMQRTRQAAYSISDTGLATSWRQVVSAAEPGLAVDEARRRMGSGRA
jgi:hypothetical protein